MKKKITLSQERKSREIELQFKFKRKVLQYMVEQIFFFVVHDVTDNIEGTRISDSFVAPLRNHTYSGKCCYPSRGRIRGG